MKTLFLDFETKDSFIQNDLGSGWAYALHNPNADFQILGCAVITYDNTRKYITDWIELLELVIVHDELVAHNAQYELGILKLLITTYPEYALILDQKPIHDTKLLFKLYDNVLPSYTLDFLAKKYLGESKGHDILIKAVIENNLCPLSKKEVKEGLLPSNEKILKFAYANMDLVQYAAPTAIAEYALLDVDQTKRLFEFVKPKIADNLVLTYSKLTNICVNYRARGVRVDIKRALEYSKELEVDIQNKLTKIYSLAGKEFNIGSSKQLVEIADKFNLKYTKTDKGNPKLDKNWMAEQDHEICKLIRECKEDINLKDNYIKKLIDMQEFTGYKGKDIGYVFPELNILQAVTGRFSSSSPNIQQQSPRVRELFLPHENENLYALDFSNQEGRLQIHYAALLNCTNVDELILEFKKNPQFDLHLKVASLMFSKPEKEITKDERKLAKTINLGISYGMGIQKLAAQLKVSYEQAKLLRNLFNERNPYLSELSEKCKNSMKQNNYVKTIAGRVSKADKPMFIDGDMQTFEYKALNKLIQGSALDQAVEVMIKADEAGIPILFPVHDEFVMSGTYEQAVKLKEIMETALPLIIPSFTEIKTGNNWMECK